jgi:hypothetical protein
MTAQTILPANSVTGGYDVANSCRFDGTAAYLNRTQGTSTNLTKLSWSGWLKRSNLAAAVVTMNYASASNYGYFYFRGTHDLRIFDRGAGGDTVAISDMLFRDTSAWYHIALIIDTTQATDTNRLKLYVNGILQGLNGVTYPAEDAALGWKVANTSNTFLSRTNSADSYLGGHLAEVAYVDGTANDITDFGEFDEDSGIWKPIDVSGLTFGNEGYYLDFEDSANLGNDVTGGTDFTENSLAAIDQTTDTCTNNFATLNPLDVNPSSAGDVFTEGNLKLVTNNNSNAAGTRSTIAVSSGKWYAEVKYTSATAWNGVAAMDVNFHTSSMGAGTISWYQGRTLYVDGSNTANWGSAVSAGDIVGIALDMDNNKVTISQGGQWWDTDAFDAAAPTTYQNLTSGYDTWGFMCRSGSAASTSEWNFGAPMFTGTDEADGDGFGSFEYAVPSGYFALCSKNLAEYG